MIPYGRQQVTEQDIEAVVDVLQSDYLTQGSVVPRFEQEVAEKVGAKHGIATNSATSALHLACLVLDVGPGDEVWTSPITFVASANCARYCGADVDFVDINPGTFNLDHENLAEKLARRRREGGRLPKVIIPVHFAGQSCDMAAIAELAEEYGFYIIEDASHAIGGRYKYDPIGSCNYSDITVFSFHPVKIITTGEGGMAMTNDIELAERMRLLRSHGITRDPVRMVKEPDGPWYYEQISLGYNYRMTDIQAALGLSQLQRLDEFVKKRQYLAARYDAVFKQTAIVPQEKREYSNSAYHLYVVRVSGVRHREIFESFRKQGINVNLHYIPVYHQPDFEKLEINKNNYPETEAYYKEAITLPLYPAISEADQEKVISVLQKTL